MHFAELLWSRISLSDLHLVEGKFLETLIKYLSLDERTNPLFGESLSVNHAERLFEVGVGDGLSPHEEDEVLASGRDRLSGSDEIHERAPIELAGVQVVEEHVERGLVAGEVAGDLVNQLALAAKAVDERFNHVVLTAVVSRTGNLAFSKDSLENLE